MDVTPRTSAEPAAVEQRRRRRLPAILAVLVLVAVGGFVVVRALGNATLFFYNADEAVAQRESLGQKRFRLQGTVDGTVVRTADGVSFQVAYNGVTVPVNHVGDPPELFQPNIPVVLEGHWSDEATASFDSDRILVKHSEQYDEQNPDRRSQADVGGTSPSSVMP